MSIRRAHPSLLAACAVALALAACGGDGDDDDPPATAGGTEAEGACALLDPGDVEDLFGGPPEVVPAGGVEGEPTSCLWEAASGDDDFPTRHQLQLSVYAGGGELDPTAYGPDPRPVDDLGEEGFVVATGALGTTAGYRDGDRTVVLVYAIVGGEDAPDPADHADDVVDLLRSAEERSG